MTIYSDRVTITGQLKEKTNDNLEKKAIASQGHKLCLRDTDFMQREKKK